MFPSSTHYFPSNSYTGESPSPWISNASTIRVEVFKMNRYGVCPNAKQQSVGNIRPSRIGVCSNAKQQSEGNRSVNICLVLSLQIGRR